MRTVIFSLRERAVLIPLEIFMLWKQLSVVALIIFILSGISPDFFSLTLALKRGIVLVYATLIAMLAGAVATPLLLPWLPFRQFWLKGAIMGSLASPPSPVYGVAIVGRHRKDRYLPMDHLLFLLSGNEIH